MIEQSFGKNRWLQQVLPFDELIFSFNGDRPKTGNFDFHIRIQIRGKWSPWLLYCSWGRLGQFSFQQIASDGSIKVYQDILTVLKGEKGEAFEIQIDGSDPKELARIRALYVYTNGDQTEEPSPLSSDLQKIALPLEGISQMKLKHSRHLDLCSPTSTTIALHYLMKNTNIDPLYFANLVLDQRFDIYGNWVFNVAQAAVELGPEWSCWVERLKGFEPIYRSLEEKIPVVTSIKGPICGGALPYAQGHLVVVIGYDPIDQNVFCIDPAFPTDCQTKITYPLSDFIEAWNRRGRIAYIFKKRGCGG